MPRTCTFCGGVGITKEHIWPKWSQSYLSEKRPVPHVQQTVQDGRDDEERTWLQRSLDMKVGTVCGSCNNGWMSNLENTVKPFFIGAFEGRGRELHRALQRDLAAWGLKTTMMVEHQQKPARYVIPPSEYAHLYKRREPSLNVLVWMTAYMGIKTSALGHLYGLDADMAIDPDPGRGTRNIWGSTVVFGPVVFHLLGTDIPGLLTGVVMKTPNTHQLWPYKRTSTWTPTPGLSDSELARFTEGFLDQLLRQGGSGRQCRPMRI